MTLRIYCPSCAAEIRTDSGICPTCGLTLGRLETDVTRQLDTGKSPSGKSSRKTISHDSIDDARFVPGTILDERYRIVGLLGKGGMGEVYRADDLKLGQPVALKFLPEHLLSDGAALARFHREVRVARQVSHKNVCRVYDIGETDGRHFLSMEYIKGEELSSLLRKEWLGIAVGWAIWVGLLMAPEFGRSHWLALVCIAIVVSAIVFCAVRFGPVAIMSTLIVMHLWVFYPITTEFTAWYASSFLLITVIVLALAGYSGYISLGGQKVFKGRFLQED